MTQTSTEHRGRGDLDRASPTSGWVLLLTGAIGLFSASALIVEKVHLLENPQADLSCDLSAFVGCGGVVNTDQASAFGFPNPLIGVVGFAIVMFVGALLVARGSVPRPLWAGLAVGTVFGVLFTGWLQVQSLLVLEMLCPYCLVVWLVMIPLSITVLKETLMAFRPDSVIARAVEHWGVLVGSLWLIALLSAIWFTFGERLWA